MAMLPVREGVSNVTFGPKTTKLWTKASLLRNTFTHVVVSFSGREMAVCNTPVRGAGAMLPVHEGVSNLTFGLRTTKLGTKPSPLRITFPHVVGAV